MDILSQDDIDALLSEDGHMPYMLELPFGECEVADMHKPGIKADTGKLRFDLLPPQWLAGLAQVATYGAKKYTDDGWRQVPKGVDRYYAAALRHLVAFRGGETTDGESGIHHLLHAAWNCLAVLSMSQDAGKV